MIGLDDAREVLGMLPNVADSLYEVYQPAQPVGRVRDPQSGDPLACRIDHHRIMMVIGPVDHPRLPL
jgi:hypothetical protein